MIRVTYDEHTGLHGPAETDGAMWTVHDSRGYIDGGPSCDECGACECATVAECGCACRPLRLDFVAHCGMRTLGIEFETAGELRRYAARFLRGRIGSGHAVTYLGDGSWEVEEPEDCAMVPDTAGILAASGTPHYFDGRACDPCAHEDGCQAEPECVGLSFAYVCLDGGDTLCSDCGEREGIEIVSDDDENGGTP